MTRRTAIPAHIKRVAWAKNNGYCTAPGCKAKGTILEHLDTWFVVREHTLENLEPRCDDHKLEKDKADIKVISKIRRLQGMAGQQKRLRERKAKGLTSTLQSRNDFKSPYRRLFKTTWAGSSKKGK